MGEQSNIGWTHHTSSPWFICTEVDECCSRCYAREFTRTKFAGFIREAYRKAGFPDWETLPLWGDKSPRVLSRGYDSNIRKWDRKAKADGVRRRTFTSMMDWLDDMPSGIVTLDGVRESMVSVVGFYLRSIFETPNLDHLLLTKRVDNFRPRLKAVIELFSPASCNDALCIWLQDWLDGFPPANVWFGYTAGTTKSWVERARQSWDVPAKVTWCSCEPMLEEFFMSDILREPGVLSSHNLDWLVLGLESGPKRRTREIRPLINLALGAKMCGIKVFVKQDEGALPGQQGRIPADVWAMKGFPTK